MVQLRHSGVYVRDIQKMASFYKHVFGMYPICENEIQEDGLICDILKCSPAKVKITKLITEQGKESGYGDMLELIQVLHFHSEEKSPGEFAGSRLYAVGTIHLAFGVEHMDATLEKLFQSGGKMETKVHDMGNGRCCCFCRDPEGNHLEIIGREH